MKIIVTGSLGHVGKPLTEELVKKGHSVTVITSKEEREVEIRALGAVPAIGSLDDVAFLTSTFSTADSIFAMVPPSFTESDQLAYYERIAKSYLQAIKKSNAKRVVYLSSYGAHLEKGTGFIVGSHRSEVILNALRDVAVTHLRPGYFYYNLFNFTAMIKGAGIMGANYGGEDRIALVAPDDIAAVAAEELTTTAKESSVRYIASDDYTANEVASILGATINKPELKWLTFSNEQYSENLIKNGVPTQIASMLVELGASIHTGVLREDYDLHKPTVMGKTKLTDFAKEFAAAFAKS